MTFVPTPVPTPRTSSLPPWWPCPPVTSVSPPIVFVVPRMLCPSTPVPNPPVPPCTLVLPPFVIVSPRVPPLPRPVPTTPGFSVRTLTSVVPLSVVGFTSLLDGGTLLT